MSSSSSSSLSQTRRTTVGIPSRCWCGSKLTTFAAQTKDNLYRRFYRCEIGVKRQSEHHLFKWIDEAIIDEIKMVDADVQSFKLATTQRLQENGRHIDESLLEMKRIIHAQALLLDQLRSNYSQDSAMSGVEAGQQALTNASSVTKSKSPLLNIAAASIALGSMAWLFAKLST